MFNTSVNLYKIAIALTLLLNVIIVYFLCKKTKMHNKEIFNIILTPVPLIYAGGKVGCFLNGCCRKMVYNGPFSVRYPYINSIKNVSYFPVQII